MTLTPDLLTFGCCETGFEAEAAAGELGNEVELEKLSSSSERCVETDFADPELTEPVPGKQKELRSYRL